MEKNNEVKKEWNASNYEKSFAFVHNYGEDVINLISFIPGMNILDIGSGTGVLANKLKQKGAKVVGIDASKEMIEIAKKNAPDISFLNIDATQISYTEAFDCVFSNAVFHWIQDQDILIAKIAKALKTEGQLVCEFGGVGCARLVHEALEKNFKKYGLQYISYFYFPSIGEYATRLEKAGLKVEFAHLFDRPTVLNKGETVLDWINMFVTQAFEGVESDLKEKILLDTKQDLMPFLMKGEDWWIDYVRIRIKAVKIQ